MPVRAHLSPAAARRALGSWAPDRASPRPAYVALADGLRAAVHAGTLALGTRLPSERDLAVALGVSRTTTSAAYDLLRDRGLVARHVGVGTVVTLPHPVRPESVDGGDAPWHDVAPGRPDGHVLDLSQAAPSAAPEVHAALEAGLERLPAYLGGRGFHPAGISVLRTAVADRYTARGVPTSPDQILVTAGAQHALALLTATLSGPGDRIVVESPTYSHALEALGASRRRLVGVPVGPGRTGALDIDLLDSTLRNASPALTYLIPDHQNPTGTSLDSDAREQVAAVARRRRAVIVGDETLTDLTYEGELTPFAAPAPDDDALVSVGSASKSFWGGLRIGWIRASTELVARLAHARGALDIASPVLEQLAVAELLARASTTLPARRDELRVRRDLLVGLLGHHLPQWRFHRPAGGLSLWVDLGAPTAARLAVAAADEGVRLSAGPTFSPDGGHRSFVRLTFAPDDAVLAAAVPRLVRAWDRVGTGA